MAKRYVRLDGNKVRTVCRVREKSLRSCADALAIDWGKFWLWLENDIGVAPQIISQLCTYLGVEEHVIAEKEDLDLREEALRKLAEIDVLIELGELSPSEYMQAWRVAAPYFLVKNKGEMKVTHAVALQDASKKFLQDITRVDLEGDDEDGSSD